LFQIATYNTLFKVPFLYITNGIHHQIFTWDASGKYVALEKFPENILHH
jgi:hypothetical protein